MGFYIDLLPSQSDAREYVERSIPGVFWVLWAITGFALTCMVLAAGDVLKDLSRSGNLFDLSMLAVLGVLVLGFFLMGFKLVGMRKFLSTGTSLRWGYRVFGKEVPLHQLSKDDIEEFNLVNRKPTPNLAVTEHDDSQYQIQGHWRLTVKNTSGKVWVLDRHVEKDAMAPLLRHLTFWLDGLVEA